MDLSQVADRDNRQPERVGIEAGRRKGATERAGEDAIDGERAQSIGCLPDRRDPGRREWCVELPLPSPGSVPLGLAVPGEKDLGDADTAARRSAAQAVSCVGITWWAGTG
jgi:hypothetical protein